MLRVLPDVKDFKSQPVCFCFKRSHEAVKEAALIPAAQQAKAQFVQVRLILLLVTLGLTLTSYLCIFLNFKILMLGRKPY